MTAKIYALFFILDCYHLETEVEPETVNFCIISSMTLTAYDSIVCILINLMKVY